MVVKIKDLPIDERPYEKLINNGPDKVSNDELLAILLKTGTKKYSAKEISNILLSEINNIGELANINYIFLTNIEGIGIKKSCVLLAAIELGKRIYNYTNGIVNKKLNSNLKA